MTFQHLLKHQQSCFPSQSQRGTLNPVAKKESGLFSAIHLLGLNVKQTGSDILYSRSCWWSRPLTFMFTTPLSFPLLPSTPLPSNSHRGSYALFVPCGLLCSSFMKSWSWLSHHPPPKIAMEESVEGPRFSVQQHNQVMSVLFKRPAGNLESRGGCKQQAGQVHRKCLSIERCPLNVFLTFKWRKWKCWDGGNMSRETNWHLKNK